MDKGSLSALSGLLRGKLAKDYPDFEPSSFISGTTPDAILSTPFVVYEYGLKFIFGEYQLAGYAMGTAEVNLFFSELEGVVKAEILAFF